MEDAYGLGGDERRLLGGFRDHGVAGDKRGAHLTEEDRERKIPRADAHKDATPAIAERVALAGRPRHRLRAERAARLDRVIAAEIDRLADFRKAIVNRLAALA